MDITRLILDLTLPVTQLLQGPGIDIANATHLIESVKSLIGSKRTTVDTFHKKCDSDILELACKVGIEECKPRTSKFQRNRNNVPSESISDHFKKVVREDLTMLLFKFIVALLLSHKKLCI